ncbi:MAG TPA: zf-HC2 domain-containing protein [Propionibacteriaceae bacterium]|nr:zf-HC2 domain-containing protein [Propionibacteriaceae bacterium]
MSSAPDRFYTWDAAYVLGSLSPAERREYEEHLAGCSTCQAAVTELAGLPGLLAQVPPEDAALLAVVPEETMEDNGPPRDMLAGVRSSHAGRRRRMVAILAGAAAALLLVLTGVAYGLGLLPLGPNGPQRLAFSTVMPSGMTAVVDLIPVAGGTDVAVQCSYGESNEPEPGGGHEVYRVYVIDRSGHATMVKEWPARPNRTMTPTGHIDLKIRQIAKVEIRESDDDETVLRATVR